MLHYGNSSDEIHLRKLRRYNGSLMVNRVSNSTKMVASSQIDITDEKYRITPRSLISNLKLESSIKKIGILTPLHLEKRGSHYRIVSGFRRFEAGLKLGIDEFPASIGGRRNETVPLDDSGESLALFKENIIEKAGERELRDLEMAIVVRQLRQEFKLEPSQVIEEYLPLLGAKPNQNCYNRLRKLGSLNDFLTDSICEKNLLENTAMRVRDWSAEEHQLLVHIIDRYRLGVNKQRRLVDLFEQLRSSLQTDIIQIWDRSGARVTDENTSESPPVRFALIFEKLYQLRFPLLSEYQERFHQLRSALKLPDIMKLEVPPYFEGNQISVSFAITDPDEFAQMGEKMIEISRQDELKKIFDLI